MFIENPVRETYYEIKNKYDGLCVLVIECDSDKINFGTGKAVAYGKKLADLIKETRHLLNDDAGIVSYETYTDFGNLGPIQVTHHV
jgi:hypothetical protein